MRSDGLKPSRSHQPLTAFAGGILGVGIAGNSFAAEFHAPDDETILQAAPAGRVQQLPLPTFAAPFGHCADTTAEAGLPVPGFPDPTSAVAPDAAETDHNCAAKAADDTSAQLARLASLPAA
ncbi:MAG: hypothetical protein B7Y31_03870, partial [Novosphingobium sp. 16-62-11]